jgi:hypothetical protein
MLGGYRMIAGIASLCRIRIKEKHSFYESFVKLPLRISRGREEGDNRVLEGGSMLRKKGRSVYLEASAHPSMRARDRTAAPCRQDGFQ